MIEETRARDDPVESGATGVNDEECHAKKDEDRRMHYIDYGISPCGEKDS